MKPSQCVLSGFVSFSANSNSYAIHKISKNEMFCKSLILSFRTTDALWILFSLKPRPFGFGQSNWADKFWGIWSIFSQTISTHFGTVSPLSMFSIIPLFNHYFYHKLSLCIHIPNIYFGLGFEFGPQRLGIQASCARSPCFKVLHECQYFFIFLLFVKNAYTLPPRSPG